MTSHDLMLLSGQIYIAASLIIGGLRGDQKTRVVTVSIGVLFVVMGLLAKRGII